jgi:hypothetical protein
VPSVSAAAAPSPTGYASSGVRPGRPLETTKAAGIGGLAVAPQVCSRVSSAIPLAAPARVGFRLFCAPPDAGP